MNPLDRERLRRLRAEAALTAARRRLGKLRDELASANDRALHAEARVADEIRFVRFIAKGCIGARATEEEILGLITKWRDAFAGQPKRCSLVMRVLGPDAISRAIEGVLRERRRLFGEDPDDDETTE